MMHSETLREEAAGWFNQWQSGDMTTTERDAFDTWVTATPDAHVAYRQLEHVWDVVGGLADDPEIAASRMQDALLYARNAPAPGRPWWRQPGALAAMAAALVMVLTFGLLAPRIGLPEQIVGHEGGGQTLATAADRLASATLADGTVVTLDAGTTLRVLEMGQRRRIELLAGRAFFRVAKDAAHPFLVTAMGKTVHAIGTAFDVRIQGETLAVTLVEGKVRVDQRSGLLHAPLATDMTAGRRLVIAPGRDWALSTIDSAQATAWLDDKLTYAPGALEQVVAGVNSGSVSKIVFVGPVFANRQVVGVFRRGDVEAVVTALELNDLAHVVARRGNRIEMAQNAPKGAAYSKAM